MNRTTLCVSVDYPTRDGQKGENCRTAPKARIQINTERGLGNLGAIQTMGRERRQEARASRNRGVTREDGSRKAVMEHA